MSDDWQAGDMALCINDGPCPVFGKLPLKKGKIYIVSRVKTGRCRMTGYVGTGLNLIGNFEKHDLYNAILFRKIKPPERDEIDQKFAMRSNSLKKPLTVKSPDKVMMP